MVEKAPDEPVQAPKIDAIFRSGSITAVSVVVGFSLGFLSRWGGLPGDWAKSDVFAVFAITLGIVLQITSLIALLSVKSLFLSRYERAIRIFVTGLILVALGVVAAIFAGLIGYGGIALHG
ncbi:hypothetical protein [Microvirga puerhi]|uniref:Uncharacterized protein n=1 Tax=Microvirga puerhi TaxID=2876078 RepID=A0ABS7VPD8_9HYPH|nr:hypothetical protein [Microvirga puerhi]MBZ6077079.1 hypothetical protein [Microvirga puerhi]